MVGTREGWGDLDGALEVKSLLVLSGDSVEDGAEGRGRLVCCGRRN